MSTSQSGSRVLMHVRHFLLLRRHRDSGTDDLRGQSGSSDPAPDRREGVERGPDLPVGVSDDLHPDLPSDLSPLPEQRGYSVSGIHALLRRQLANISESEMTAVADSGTPVGLGTLASRPESGFKSSPEDAARWLSMIQPTALQLVLCAICCFAATFLFKLGVWPSLFLLGAVAAIGVAMQLRTAPGNPSRRLIFGPLMLFVLAFVLILGSRALALALGTPGRVFAVDASGHVVSSTIVPPAVRRSGDYNSVRNPSLESGLRDWGVPESNAVSGFRGTLELVRGKSFDGNEAAEGRFYTGVGSSYVDIPIGVSENQAKARVRPGSIVSGSIAARTFTSLPPRARIALNVIYYTATDHYIKDRTLSGPRSHGAVVSPRLGRWYVLYGTDHVPATAAYANLLILVRNVKDGSAYRLRADAAYLTPRAHSRTDFRRYSARAAHLWIWRDAYLHALAAIVAMLAAVLLGFTLAVGRHVAERIPELTLANVDQRRVGRWVIGLAILGFSAYILEIRSYGGYGSYLRGFGTDPSSGAGKWYLHTVALIPSSLAVILIAERISGLRKARWRPWEFAVVIGGTITVASYASKSTIAIPVLTLLLFYYAYSRRGVRYLAYFAGLFAILTPFVYQIRGSGTGHLGTLVSGEYWREFLTNLQSRFYHFESLMVLIPFNSSESPWQPVTDFFVNIVPRYLWAGKPLSTDPRFTHEYLQGALHSANDIGVISLPGEMWAAGGLWALLGMGIVLGICLRVTNDLMTRPRKAPGTTLLAVTGLTTLIFFNDGWGVATAITTILLSAVTWLAFLRPEPQNDV